METLMQLSENVGQTLLRNKRVLVTAESCTGGGIASAITDVAAALPGLIAPLLLIAMKRKWKCWESN